MSYNIFIPEKNQRFILSHDDAMAMHDWIGENKLPNASKNFLSHLDKYKDGDEWEWLTPGLWYSTYCAIIKPRIMKRVNDNIHRVIDES